MKICILTIATNQYLQFLDDLLENLSENFLSDHDLHCLLFTNHEILETSDNVTVHQIEHESWPIPTLKRYNYFMEKKDFISTFDYCYYFDVDMAVIDKVGDEVLSDLVGTQHPWQTLMPPTERSYDRNPKSLAYVPPGEEGPNYYAGGFNGGKTEKFLQMAEVIANRVIKDLDEGVIAKWHDESHLNRYMIDNPPTLSLSPNYCFDEQFLNKRVVLPDGNTYPFQEPKIVALKKDYDKLRS